MSAGRSPKRGHEIMMWKRNTVVRQYQQAADAGDAEAQFEMGVLHQDGRGVPQDFGKAVALYLKAAEQGHLGAQSNLGVLYVSGRGIPRDYGEALKWFTRAAEQGDVFAQNNLCRLYSFGEGVPQDYVKAYMWLELAICGLEGSQKEKAVMNRDMFLSSHMNPAEIERAKKMVLEWKASHSH
jgi:TPR repeat protein